MRPAAGRDGQFARRLGLRNRRQFGGAGELHVPDLGERPWPGATQVYAIAIGSNRPHGRHGRPPASSRRRSPGSIEEFGLFDASPIVLNAAHGGAGRDFANAVALVESELEPPERCSPRLKAMEREFGRRRGRRWGPRVLDLDIVLWSGGGFRTRRLTIPHPQLGEARASCFNRSQQSRPAGGSGPLTVRHLAHRLARSAPHEANRRIGSGPIAQLVEQLTFNQ